MKLGWSSILWSKNLSESLQENKMTLIKQWNLRVLLGWMSFMAYPVDTYILNIWFVNAYFIDKIFKQVRAHLFAHS